MTGDKSVFSPSSVMGLGPADCVSSTILAATVAVAQGTMTKLTVIVTVTVTVTVTLTVTVTVIL
jgi:hypothetical protein